MIAIVLIAHAHLAKETKLAIEHILGRQQAFAAIDVPDSSVSLAEQQRLQLQAKSMDMGQGVLMMVDLLGATPCNIARATPGVGFDVEVVAGFNLPAVIKAMTLRQEGVSLARLAEASVASGQQYMCLPPNFQKVNADD